ncbi:hypothetical protein ID866_6022 [Astraeus odoratus]|nr:hypothetical protein ID866_6022 [Astraeus odoratus]
MADYDFRPGGALKFKGGVADGGIVKKKKKSKSRSQVEDKQGKERERDKQRVGSEEADVAPGSAPGSNRGSPSLSGRNESKTEAERRFEQVQRRRLAARVAKYASKTHKDRVNEFNSKLEALSEHHDIPKACLQHSRCIRMLTRYLQVGPG